MAAAMAMRGGSSNRGGGSAGMDSGKYVRYTPEQIEALERVYADCPKPTSSRRQQLLRECPILANIEARQIKVWFQNRRCRDKLRKESSRLESVNRKVSAMNKLLMEENERLQKQVSQLVHENAQVRQQLKNTSMANDTSCESNVTTPQNPLRDTSNPSGLLSIAEETLSEFLSKATGTAIDWVQLPGMKVICQLCSFASNTNNMFNNFLITLFFMTPAWSGFGWYRCHFTWLPWCCCPCLWFGESRTSKSCRDPERSTVLVPRLSKP